MGMCEQGRNPPKSEAKGKRSVVSLQRAILGRGKGRKGQVHAARAKHEDGSKVCTF